MSDETTSEQLAEIKGQAVPVQVCEGRWRTRDGELRDVTPTPEGDGREERWPWWDGQYRQTWAANGRYHFGGESPLDLVEYLGAIEPEPKPQAEPQPEPADTADQLRNEVSYVQNLLGTERRRVVELEALVASLRTIYEGSEKAVDAAGMENTALRTQLAVAKAELTTAAAVCQQLQIELDAALQVPADSPELRELRLNLTEVTRDRDTYKNAYDRIFADLETIRETTTADTVEAIIEWLSPFRGCNSPALALLLIEALPDIIRNIVGLNTEDVE